ncbi:MAG: insulinase family protein [Rickettsiales bacterium]|nr:insulinase family protein [Rickettsiales bacterium]
MFGKSSFRSVVLFLGVLVLAPFAALATDIKEIAGKDNTRITAWAVEEHNLPIVSITLAFKEQGAAYDPVGKEGLAYLFANLLDEGAGTLNQLDFNKELEGHAIQLGFEIDHDTLLVRIKTLSEHLDKALELTRLALTEPRFDPETVARVKTQITSMIAKKEESPEHMAQLLWQKEAYGEHPYARPVYGKKSSIDGITVEDLHAFLRRVQKSPTVYMTVVGDITKKDVVRILDGEFAKIVDPTTEALPPLGVAKVREADPAKPFTLDYQVPQAVAIFGFEGIGRKNPEFYPAYLLNYVLGGGSFDSRLMKEVREKRGLAYSVYTYLDMYPSGGAIKGYVATKNVHIAKSMDVISKQIGRMQNEGITAEELQQAKDYLLGSLPIKLSSNDALVGYLMSMRLEGLPREFMDQRNGLIQKVTLEDVNRVARQLLRSENMLVVQVGGAVEGVSKAR